MDEAPPVAPDLTPAPEAAPPLVPRPAAFVESGTPFGPWPSAFGASPAEAATAEMARAGADDRRTHKIALVRRLAAATIEDAGSAR